MDDEQGVVQSECKHRGSSLDLASAFNTLSSYRLAWQVSIEFLQIMMAVGQTMKHTQKILGIFGAAILSAQALASEAEAENMRCEHQALKEGLEVRATPTEPASHPSGCRSEHLQRTMPFVSSWTFRTDEGFLYTAVSAVSLVRRSGLVEVNGAAGTSRLSWDFSRDGIHVKIEMPSLEIDSGITQIVSSSVHGEAKAKSMSVSPQALTMFNLTVDGPQTSRDLSLVLEPKSRHGYPWSASHANVKVNQYDLEIDGVSVFSPLWISSEPAEEIAEFNQEIGPLVDHHEHFNALVKAVETGRKKFYVPRLPSVLLAFISAKGLSESISSADSVTPGLNSAADVIACGLTCLGAIGGAVGTGLSGGTTSFALFLAAAGCGTCLGSLTEPDLPPPVFVGPGSRGSIGETFPSLPPGYGWVCDVFGEEGESVCRPVPEHMISP